MHNTFISKHFPDLERVWGFFWVTSERAGDQDKKPDAARPVKRWVSMATE